MIQNTIFIIFFFINLALFISHSIYIFFDLPLESGKVLVSIMKLLIVMRFLRVFILLNKVSELSNVFELLKSIKYIIGALLNCQFTFFYIYSSITMLIIGGKIKKDTYKGNTDNIPENYYHINFNDFGSAFITCFSLMMVNNTNILITSLSFVISSSLKFYFLLFYFIAIMLLLNICHTFILDIYIKIKKKDDNIQSFKEYSQSVLRESRNFESIVLKENLKQ